MTTYLVEDPSQLNFNITTRLLIEQALKRGWRVEYTPAYPDENDSGIARCFKGGKEFFFDSDLTALTPIYGFYAANNKNLTYGLMVKNDVPTPKTEVVAIDASDGAVADVLKIVGVPALMKPLSTNHGVGITFDIMNIEDVRKGIRYSSNFSKSNFALLQQQVTGKEYRFLVVEGKVIAVAHRRPPFVVGDGRHTIGDLVDILNTDPRRSEGHKSPMTKIDTSEIADANRQGFLNTIPAIDEEVVLLATSNLSRGGMSVDYTDTASPELKTIASRAATACFLGVAGVDIMTTDIENGDATNSYVIEVNSAPGLRMHEYPGVGKPRPVARQMFTAMEKHATSIKTRTTKVGRVEMVSVEDIGDEKISARIDTGATYSAIWASGVETNIGLEVSFMGGKYKHTFQDFSRRVVRSSTGHSELRYVVKLLVKLGKRRINAKFTLADRSMQTYPILIGRNVLRNKFHVDVAMGKPNRSLERQARRDIERKVKDGRA